ncbi:hypothetical protein RFI_38231 [Reticulomyxa filosa]|uniref:DOCKER domain-containing protein n=1 Tax=Reticulomyxa filosa TaxID=46433 RepID=X6LET2_RETFI|nr:hypothetical protein RFI_38231 [Reticulomyxa filosa]|eukprot:ETN99249.1 hypothetical protein RFI_38231 [Reticulomyxa filosa]
MEKSFNKGLWNVWLALGMSFLSHRDFAIEDLPKQKADIIRDYYGDIRTIAIGQLRSAWDVLKSHRSDLAETMVAATIAASASNVPEIQEFAEDVYFQMMKTEFETTNAMKNVETHTIDQIDLLTVEHGNNETIMNRYLNFFRKRVNAKLANTNTKLKKMGVQFVDEIEKLYEYLVQLRKLPSDAMHEDERTLATLKLLQYLDKGGKIEMYNRYVHKLALMHAQLGNHIESGRCYVQHASRLGWSDRILRGEPNNSLEEQSEWKRHVQLLDNAYQQFLIGEAWEMAVKVCQELCHVYETVLFDLKALSTQLEKQSQCWKFISQHDRVFHSHFLLSFRGDFPDELRGSDFIYRSGRGKNPESVMDFTNRIKTKWKDAKIVNSSDRIPPENESPDFKEQFIRIAKLNPSSPEEIDGGDFKWKNTKAPLRMKQYYREMELNTFYFTYQDKRKKKKEGNEFRNLWITQVFVIAEETIPSIRRCVPVIKHVSKTFSPLQTAINNLNVKTQELINLVEVCELDPSHDIRSLSMSVNGVLDAAVMGGVAKYQEAFFDSDYFDETPQDKNLAEKFKEALRWQLQEAEKALGVYAKHRPDNLADHVTHLEECLIKMKRDLMEFLAHPRRKF